MSSECVILDIGLQRLCDHIHGAIRSIETPLWHNKCNNYVTTMFFSLFVGEDSATKTYNALEWMPPLLHIPTLELHVCFFNNTMFVNMHGGGERGQWHC